MYSLIAASVSVFEIKVWASCHTSAGIFDLRGQSRSKRSTTLWNHPFAPSTWSRPLCGLSRAMPRVGIGVDVGGTKTKVAIVTPQGKTLRWIEIPTRYGQSADKFVQRVTSILRLTESEMDLDVAGIGLALAGEVDSEKGLLRVSPRMLHRRHPLVVEGTLNAVMIETDMAGKIMLSGKGAGSIETASAIIGDILYIMKHHVKGN